MHYLHFRPLLEDTAVGHLVVLGALPEADPQRGEHPERLVDDHVEVLHADEGAVVREAVLGLGAAEGIVNLLLKPLLNVRVQRCIRSAIKISLVLMILSLVKSLLFSSPKPTGYLM